MDLCKNDFDDDDFDTVDSGGDPGAYGVAPPTIDPTVCFQSTASPDRRTGVNDAHGRAEDVAPEDIATFIVTNPERTISVSALMDGRIDDIQLSTRVASMSETRLASEILMIADLARQKAQAAQYTFILDRMAQLADGDGQHAAQLRESVSTLWNLPTPEQAAAAEAEAFATHYQRDCPEQSDGDDDWGFA
ncbi:secretion protein EspD [Mycobacterium kansasii]|uniref:secretion protein EspD n=1 Tax=Mycobacterium kansasii TaxID=1768 RepID=UPI000CDE40C6|nr:secretion protein EspD [Mycobacterium kansasii]POX94119.1 secretion protein EspD [Mycobacterium kansasii]POY16828.1 secretion protein EspD [Mycobacterium kansasii]